MVGWCAHIMSLKNSSMLRAAPKIANVIFQLQISEMKLAKFNMCNVVGFNILHVNNIF
jgi:hypothetical protein